MNHDLQIGDRVRDGQGREFTIEDYDERSDGEGGTNRTVDGGSAFAYAFEFETGDATIIERCDDGDPIPYTPSEEASAVSGTLDRIAEILRAPSWTVGMLEDIGAIMRSAGFDLDRPPRTPYVHH